MIKRIHIKGYKSLQDLEVKLGPFCVLFGPNASGKSNFLDALQLIGRIVQSRTLKEAFAAPYRGSPLESFSFPDDGLKGLLLKHYARFSVEVDIELSDLTIKHVDRLIKEMKQSGAVMVKEEAAEFEVNAEKALKSQYIREKYLRYRIEVEILPRSGILRVVDEHVAALSSKGELKTGRNPFLEKIEGKLHLRMEGQAHPTYHDVHLDHSILSMPLYPPHYPHITALKQELSGWSVYYFEPREKMRGSNSVKEVTHIGLMGEELAPFLNTLKATEQGQNQLRGIAKAMNTIIPSITDIDVDVNDIGEVELKIIEGNVPIPARVVSEGTLRVLGLLSLSASKEPITLVGFEEPENGVHPRRIRLIAELLKTMASGGNAQIIVTTHSPILPDLIPDENLYVCRRSKGVTEIKPFSIWGELAKNNAIDEGLEELPAAEKMPVSVRMLRGDFDA